MDFQEFCRQFNIAQLNSQQEAAVKRVNGATLLLATPGSGKTTVIVARTGYMTYVAGIPARNILTLTYTKAAATEMQERFIKKFQTSPANTPKFSTINSFCVSVINTCGREKGIYIPRLLTNNEKLIREIAVKMSAEYPTDTTIHMLTQKVGKVKNELMQAAEIEAINDFDFNFLEFYTNYQNALQQTGQMDFDDQLIMAYNLLQAYPDILTRAHNTFQYVSLDEAQDTSLIQHKIVQLLVGRQGNIFMVGDEDQSIYGFRGAYPAALLNFGNDYDNAGLLYMETNYRSDQAIVNAANQFIKRNELRNNKNMKAASQGKGLITITKVPELMQEYDMLMDRIGDFLNRPEETLAILAKNNESLLPLIDRAENMGLPIRCRDAGGSFFGHFLVNDLLNIIAFANDRTNAKLFSGLYYKLGLYIQKQTVDMANQAMEEAGKDADFLAILSSFCVQQKQKDGINRLRRTLDQIVKAKPAAAVSLAMDDTGYNDGWVQRKIDEGTSEQSLTLKYNILRLLARRYDNMAEFLAGMERLRDPDSDIGANIILSTIHSSKGLEFDHVIIIDTISGILPSGALDMTQNEREEEARMFYVGATRARHTLELMVPEKINGLPLDTSEFVQAYASYDENGFPKAQTPPPSVLQGKPKTDKNNKPIKEKDIYAWVNKEDLAKPWLKCLDIKHYDLKTCKPGSLVVHRDFGPGAIAEISASGIISVSFNAYGKKQFLLSKCQELGVMLPVNNPQDFQEEWL